MSKKISLIDVRNALESMNKTVMSERGDGVAPSSEVIDRVLKLHDKDIRTLTPALLRMALNKLNNDVSSRKGPKVLTNNGIDLFGRYHGIPKSITIIKGQKKDISKASVQEVNLFLRAADSHTHEDKNPELKRLMAEHSEYIVSQDDSIELLMKRRLDAEGNGRLEV